MLTRYPVIIVCCLYKIKSRILNLLLLVILRRKYKTPNLNGYRELADACRQFLWSKIRNGKYCWTESLVIPIKFSLFYHQVLKIQFVEVTCTCNKNAILNNRFDLRFCYSNLDKFFSPRFFWIFCWGVFSFFFRWRQL